MNPLFSGLRYFSFGLFFLNCVLLNAENIPSGKSLGQDNQILIESNTQRSDFENSIFHAEGDVRITNSNKEFFAKSKKAVFYKIDGIIKLIGDVQVITSDSSTINAGEMLYYVEENKFEAISASEQRVNTKFIFNKDKTIDKSQEK